MLVAPRLGNAHQFLADDPPGSDGEVTDFRIAHLIVGQPDMGAAGLNQAMGIGVPEGVHDGRLGTANGVVDVGFAVTPSIKDGQHHGGDAGFATWGFTTAGRHTHSRTICS